MNALDIQLRALVKCLESQKINYVILGGVALSIYGEPRFTADIDVNIILGKNEISGFLKKSKKYGFFSETANAEKIARKYGVISLGFKKGKTTGKFDIIMAENPIEYAAVKRGRIKTLGLVRARFISPEDLIIHKITSQRPRDFEDLKGIMMRQKGKLDLKYIKGWLKKIDNVNKKGNLTKAFEELLKDKRPCSSVG